MSTCIPQTARLSLVVRGRTVSLPNLILFSPDTSLSLDEIQITSCYGRDGSTNKGRTSHISPSPAAPPVPVAHKLPAKPRPAPSTAPLALRPSPEQHLPHQHSPVPHVSGCNTCSLKTFSSGCKEGGAGALCSHCKIWSKCFVQSLSWGRRPRGRAGDWPGGLQQRAATHHLPLHPLPLVALGVCRLLQLKINSCLHPHTGSYHALLHGLLSLTLKPATLGLLGLYDTTNRKGKKPQH